MPDDLQQKIFFSNTADHRLPECSEHNAGGWTKLKVVIDGNVWVSQDGFRLQFCPVCLVGLIQERFDVIPDDVLDGSKVLLRSVIADDDDSPMEEFMRDLGPGEITDGSVYLFETPPVRMLPAWIIEEGLCFVDSDNPRSIDDDYRAAFRDRFGYTPEAVSADEFDGTVPNP